MYSILQAHAYHMHYMSTCILLSDLPDTVNPLKKYGAVLFDLWASPAPTSAASAGPAPTGSAPAVTGMERMSEPKPLLLYQNLQNKCTLKEHKYEINLGLVMDMPNL